MAAIQARAWTQVFGTLFPELPAALDPAATAKAWRQAVTLAAGGGPYAVFAATDPAGPTSITVGFAALGPLLDPDGGKGAAELVALHVDPPHQRQGHGSRLLAAVADAARSPSNVATRLSTWVAVADVVRQRFLKQAGFGADGATRAWHTDAGSLVDEQRWSARLD
jgi:GNAT superfamily N-acetyltransferase